MIAALLPFILYILFIFYLFDRVVKFEYGNYRKNWISDGKPIGFFWVPEEGRGKFLGLPKIGSGFARGRCTRSWIYTTPEWAKGDARAAKLLLQYKLAAILPVLLIFIWFVFALFKQSENNQISSFNLKLIFTAFQTVKII